MQEIKMVLSEVDLKTTYMQIQHYGLSSKLNCIIGLQICIVRIHDNINSMTSEEEKEEEEEEEDDDDEITVHYMNFPRKNFFYLTLRTTLTVLCNTCRKIKNDSAFCPHSVGMCFVRF